MTHPFEILDMNEKTAFRDSKEPLLETLIKTRDRVEGSVRDGNGATMEDLKAIQMMIQNLMTRGSAAPNESLDMAATLMQGECKKPVPPGSGLSRVNSIFAKHTMDAPSLKIAILYETYRVSLENDFFVFTSANSANLTVAIDEVYKTFNEGYSSLSGVWECSQRISCAMCSMGWRELAMKTKPFLITRCSSLEHLINNTPIGTREWILKSSGPGEVTSVSCASFLDEDQKYEGMIWIAEEISVSMPEMVKALDLIRKKTKINPTIHCEQNVYYSLEKVIRDMPLIWFRVMLKSMGFGGQASIRSVHKVLFGLESSSHVYTAMNAKERSYSDLAGEHYMFNNIRNFSKRMSEMGIKICLGNKRTFDVSVGMMRGDWLYSDGDSGCKCLENSLRMFYKKRRPD